MIDLLRHIFYAISNALFVPLLTVLLAAALWTLALVGGILREGLSRRKVRRLLAGLAEVNDKTEALERMRCGAGIPALFAKSGRGWPQSAAQRERALEELETAVARSLAPLAWLTRIGPMLGLLGTLIPLGPALTGLASGDIALLSNNLVVAFTSTVVGVFIGCVAFTLHLVRHHWYQRDMGDMEEVLQRLT